MPTFHYRLVNVFAEERLAGNPLCVFEDGRGLDEATMQALALQFNLSETTFVLPSTVATKRVRIFTPTFEMPFAGHPTLGTAHVVRHLVASGDAVTLEMHGTANVHFAFGGRVAGGFYGEAPALDRLGADGNTGFAIDFRQVYATVLERWWGVPAERLLAGWFSPIPFVHG